MTIKLYDMWLHDSHSITDGITVTRVPGGWIYSSIHHTQDHPESPTIPQVVFVPYDDEFKLMWDEDKCEATEQYESRPDTVEGRVKVKFCKKCKMKWSPYDHKEPGSGACCVSSRRERENKA